MADRIVVMHEGMVEQIGTPLELYDSPANLFVAGFIGFPAMNIFECMLEGDMFIATAGSRISLGTHILEIDGQPVTLGIRPEHCCGRHFTLLDGHKENTALGHCIDDEAGPQWECRHEDYRNGPSCPQEFSGRRCRGHV
mgnify:CR=1 FL=1